jgi:hypothetical protein
MLFDNVEAMRLPLIVMLLMIHMLMLHSTLATHPIESDSLRMRYNDHSLSIINATREHQHYMALI